LALSINKAFKRIDSTIFGRHPYILKGWDFTLNGLGWVYRVMKFKNL
jgi:hypothetical protein